MSGKTERSDLLPLHRESSDGLNAGERATLLDLQARALTYFIENQAASGLILDRQSNRGRLRAGGLCSMSATGMGMMALAIAAEAPHRLLSRRAAVRGIAAALEAAEIMAHERGILPHFIDSRTRSAVGEDRLSTIDTAWLLVGGLWSAAFLRDQELAATAQRLYERVDWRYWTAPDDPHGRGLLRHGRRSDGSIMAGSWDRLNGETIFLYVLAAGAEPDRALEPSAWGGLQPFYGTIADQRFNNSDLGLFVFQYGLDLLDLRRWRVPGGLDLHAEARIATAANREVCRAEGSRYQTYRHYWGLSAGDGPDRPPSRLAYRAYSPAGPIDGTAHLTAALGSVAHEKAAVFENLHAAKRQRRLNPLGRYGFSNINLDYQWVGRDMVGIDAGAAVLALDNMLADGRVRHVFHTLPCVRRGLARSKFVDALDQRLAS